VFFIVAGSGKIIPDLIYAPNVSACLVERYCGRFQMPDGLGNRVSVASPMNWALTGDRLPVGAGGEAAKYHPYEHRRRLGADGAANA